MGDITQRHQLTLVEMANRSSNKQLQEIAEVLDRENDILTDLQFVEANNVTRHSTTRRNYLPQGEARQLNKGVGRSATQTVPIEEEMTMIETYSVVDKRLAAMSGNAAKFRKDEDIGIVSGLGQQMAEVIVYGNRSNNLGEINGLAYRRSELADPNVVDGGGTTGEISSLYIIQHGTQYFHGHYPRGSQSGIVVRDLGEDTVTDEDGKEFQAYRTHFAWDLGMTVRDERSLQRVANIQVDADTLPRIDNFIIQALNQMPNRGNGAVIYANRDVFTVFDQLANDKANAAFGFDTVFGRQVVTFRGHRIGLMESILSAEDVVA